MWEAGETARSVTTLPFNTLLGIERATGEGELLRLPAGAQYLNHLGTVHASAQLALAEASSGEFLLRHLGATDGLIPVVRRVQAKFRQPANGALVSAARLASGTLEQITEDLAGRGRALVTVKVELHDSSGAHTLSAEFEWFIQRVQTSGSAAVKQLDAGSPQDS